MPGISLSDLWCLSEAWENNNHNLHARIHTLRQRCVSHSLLSVCLCGIKFGTAAAMMMVFNLLVCTNVVSSPCNDGK
jgi:hypothetical protein